MEILSEQELASLLQISKWTVRKWRLEGGLPHIQVARRIFYRMETVQTWMAEMERSSATVQPRNRGNFVPVA